MAAELENELTTSNVRLGNLQFMLPGSMLTRVEVLSMPFTNLAISTSNGVSNKLIHLGIIQRYAEKLPSHIEKGVLSKGNSNNLREFFDHIASDAGAEEKKTLLRLLDVDGCVPALAKKLAEISVYRFECEDKPTTVYYVLDGIGDLYYAKGIVHAADKTYLTQQVSFVK